jgi:uncharacterized LabA/DUF88 family protein
MERVIAYVDGFNLYFGLKSKNWRRYYWLNLQTLAQRLLKPHQQLVFTKYFTSRVSSSPWDPHKSKRQNTYIEALMTLSDIEVQAGHYLAKTIQCKKCGHRWVSHEEKMTDVNIAVEMTMDAFQNRFDTALLISADSDLTRAIETIQGVLPQKRVIVAFPPDRHSARLRQIANASFTIGRKNIADSQFPDAVTKPDGFVLHRPSEWS